MKPQIGKPARGAGKAALAALCLLLVLDGLVRSLPGEGLLDYGSFLASGRAAAEGLNPYGIHPLTFHVVLPGFESWNPNLNPPISVLAFQLFDLFDPHHGFRIWWAISILCHVATVALLVRRYAPDHALLAALAAFVPAGLWDTLVLGQIYLPLVLAATVAWLLLERGSAVAAGILIGSLVAVKLNFLVWPALLFLAGHRRAALAAVVSASAISVVPLAVYGPEVYRQWAELVMADGARGVFLTNVSLFGLAARAELPGLAPYLGLLLLAGLGIWALRTRPGILRASAVGIAGALLASPVAWIHYTLFLLPALFAIGRSWPFAIVAGLLTIPVPAVLALSEDPAWLRATAGSCYGWAVILFLAAILLTGPKAGPAVAPLVLRHRRAG